MGNGKVTSKASNETYDKLKKVCKTKERASWIALDELAECENG